jgi:hypothetical protein
MSLALGENIENKICLNELTKNESLCKTILLFLYNYLIMFVYLLFKHNVLLCIK